ncbi:class I SAM-dependent methyltransferase [Streptomyces sp. STR69]|uniref:class I SAM-dependent methyltransferase n=1 Tax=Streptomyces sp. STR69 TaxID=1796942 RepID=UPI0021C78589|nr:class I SAM-dependent methyltransferase [Streptomyces sp. STR69]
MSDHLDTQIPYWDAASATKTFTHPLHLPWLEGISRQAAMLDYGCGYGRTMDELQQHGFRDLTGADISPAMIERAQHLHPALHFTTLDTPPSLPSPDAAFDVVLLFAVLTCVPGDEAQHRLIAELHRVLKPGGVLYVSDLLLQNDERNRSRYEHYATLNGGYGAVGYGVFQTGDGAVCRHHSREWFTTLLLDFEGISTRTVTVSTMNGHESTGIQILARKAAVT